MGPEIIELTGSECPECGKQKNVAVSISSRCRECGLDSLFMKYEIPAEKIEGALSAILRVLDMNGLLPVESAQGIDTFDELIKRLNQ